MLNGARLTLNSNVRSQKKKAIKNSCWCNQNPQTNGKVSFARLYNAQTHAESEAKGRCSSGKTHSNYYIKLTLTPLFRKFKEENVGQSTFFGTNWAFCEEDSALCCKTRALKCAVKCVYECARPGYNLDIGASKIFPAIRLI